MDRSYSRAIALGFSIASILLGVAVLVGWYTNTKILIQIVPTFVPMQYNTALCFMVSGLGFLLALYQKRFWAILFGSIAFALGFLTSLEYLFHIDLGIDELFMKHLVMTKTSHPGRMAPNTAICFMLSGIEIVLMSRRFAKPESMIAG